MLFDVTIFGQDETEFGSEGLCGPLPMESCKAVEEAGGTYELEAEIAYDEAGKWKYAQTGRVLKAWVQTRRADGVTMEIAPQLFDIYSITWGDESLTAYARHVSYRLMKNLTVYRPAGSVTLAAAAAGILNGCLDAHPFSVTAEGGTARTLEGWAYVNPIDAIMAPDTGLLQLYGAGLVRDNFQLRIKTGVGIDRGITIEPGKNLEGVDVTEDDSSLATYLVPIGSSAAGDELLLPEIWVVSSHAGEYARKYIYAFQASDASVGGDLTVAQAYANMRQEAADMLAGGCDRVGLTVKVDVCQVDALYALGEDVTWQRRIIAQLEPMPVYDIVKVITAQGLTVSASVVRREWDCLHGRLEAIELGTAADGLSGMQIATWQVPSGISGSKLSIGSLPGSALQNGSVPADKLGTGTTAAIVAATQAAIEAELPAMIQANAWPVGSVYLSASSADPGDTFGGVWSAIGSGMIGTETVYYFLRES